MPSIWNIEWLNSNAQRNYPLSEAASGTDITGTLTLPEDVIVDLLWTVHSAGVIDPAKFHLSTVVIFSTNVILGFGYDGTQIAAVTITKTTPPTINKSYQVTGVGGSFFDSVIKVTIGRLDTILTLPAGTWAFDLAGGRLEPTVIRPDLRGISSVVTVNGTDRSIQLQDEIEIAAGSNIDLTVSTVGSVQQIRIDAIDGAGLNEDCECAGRTSGVPITTINGIPPDATGDFTLQGDACLELVSDISNGLRLNEKCAEPCCECTELEVVTQAAQELQNRVTDLESYAQRMEAVIDQMRDVILVSRLNNPGPCGTP